MTILANGVRELEANELDLVSGGSLEGWVRGVAGAVTEIACNMATKGKAVVRCAIVGETVANAPPMEGHSAPKPVSYGV